ncbi:hypothetical protein AAGV37_24895 [Pseudomonas protegens]|uniref:hypothetical protein n=1 Tax=Pseudomonas protegens TaxID=380021 RepID=UPI0031595457
MLFKLTIAEEYEVIMRFHLYRSAIDSNNKGRADAILSELDAIVQKAIREKRLDDDELNKIILFTGQYPDLKEMASKKRLGYADIIQEAYPHRPYTSDVAETLRMLYI